MNWASLFDPALSGRLCLTLLHSVWQVALLAAIAWCLDWLWRKKSVELRYIVHVGALVIALVTLPVTYRLIDVADSSTAEFSVEPMPEENVLESSAPLFVSGAEDSELDVSPAVPVTLTEPAFLPSAVPQPPVDDEAIEGASPLWFQLAPWIVVFYATGVVVMLIRLLIGILRINRQAAQAARIEDSPLVTILRSLAERWSMTIVPVLAQAEHVLVPKLVGLVRPTILLPASAVSGMSVEELELILAHELAHVRRRDMWINLLQRITEAVLFFNPALWYLTRRISTLREYCCDDMVCRSQSESNDELRLRYATALLRVTEMAHPQLADRADLAALAASGRSPSEIRRRVARLLGESVREPLQFSRGGWMALLAVVTVSILGPALWKTYAEPTEEKQTVQEEGDAKPGEFRLTVVGPDGKPVPQAAIHLRTHPEVTADQILRGEFVKSVSYGPYVKTDGQGRLTILRAESSSMKPAIRWKVRRCGPVSNTRNVRATRHG